MKRSKLLFTTFIAIAFSLLLSGCPGTTGPVIVRDTKVVFIKPDASMVKDCDVEAPPEKTAYLAGDFQTKEAMSSFAYRNQTTNVGKCNKQIGGLRDWYTKQEKIYGVPVPERKP